MGKRSTRPPEHESDEVENGALSGVTWRMSLGWEVLGLTNQVRCQCPPSPKPGLTRMHQEMNSEATSSGSPLESSCATKRGESNTEGSDEPNHTRSGRDERSVEKYEEGVRRYDEDHAGDGGRPGHVEKVV